MLRLCVHLPVMFNSVYAHWFGHLDEVNVALCPSYLFTSCSRVLEKLTWLQLDKISPAFYGTGRFITAFAFAFARQLSVSWASIIQSVPPHPTSTYACVSKWTFCLRYVVVGSGISVLYHYGGQRARLTPPAALPRSRLHSTSTGTKKQLSTRSSIRQKIVR
jgi:hypothetical protein